MSDLFALSVPLLLAVIFMPTLEIDWSVLGRTPVTAEAYEDVSDQMGRVLAYVTSPMASIYLLMALGFLLVLRRGGIDLSVWAAAGVGGLAAAALIRAGVPAAGALVLGAGAGALLGAVNALLTVRLRVPAVVATLLTGGAVVLALTAVTETRAVTVAEGTFDSWRLVQRAEYTEPVNGSAAENGGASRETTRTVRQDVVRPRYLTRMLLVTLVFGGAALLLGGTRRTAERNDRRALAVALVASGLLSAAAGAIWLVEHGETPIPGRLVGDLRVPAAALLAGGLLLAGARRTVVTVAALPVALLLTLLWTLHVWMAPVRAYYPQLLLLIVGLTGAHLAVRHAVAAPRLRRGALVAAGLMTGGIVVAALEARVEGTDVRGALLWAGILLWAGGAVTLGISAAVRWRRERGARAEA